MAAPSQFRLSAKSLADLDALAASNGGVRTPALRDAIAYWRSLVEAAGRENAEHLTVEEWTLLGHAGQPDVWGADLDDESAPAPDWSKRIAVELATMFDGRPLVLPSQREEAKLAKRLARKVGDWGVVRGYALMAALRYFWGRPEAGIAACAAPEVWMTPTARE